MSKENGCRVRFRRVGDDYVGHMTIHAPEVGSVITVAGWGGSMASALKRAASVAQRISNDPVMSALIPPQARLAIMAAKKLAGAAKRGKPQLKAALSQFGGPGAKRLAAVLAASGPAPATPTRAPQPQRSYPPQYAPQPPTPPQYADEGDNSYDDADEEYADEEYADGEAEAVEGIFSGLKRAAKFAVNPIAHTKATFRAARGIARKVRGKKKRAPEPMPAEEYADEEYADEGDAQGYDEGQE